MSLLISGTGMSCCLATGNQLTRLEGKVERGVGVKVGEDVVAELNARDSPKQLQEAARLIIVGLV